MEHHPMNSSFTFALVQFHMRMYRLRMSFLSSGNMSRYIIIITICLLKALTSFSQLDSSEATVSAPKWYRDFLRESSFVPGYSVTQIEDQKAWKWECIGPNVRPEELNPGGKAIPAYAVNRGNGTGRINYLFVHPTDQQRVWACSPTGGLWYTHNGGKHWHTGGTDQLPISGVSSVAVNLQNHKQWIVATGDGDDQFMFSNGIWITSNAGRSYFNINGNDPSTAFPFNQYEDATFIGEVVCKPDVFSYAMVASNKGLWVCEDIFGGKGNSWLARVTGRIRKANQKWKRVVEGNFYDIEIIPHPTESENIIVAAGEKLVVSYDGGSSWETMPQPEYQDPERYRFLRLSVEYSPALPYFLQVAVTCSEGATASKSGESSIQLFDLKTKTWIKIKDLRGDVSGMNSTRARAFAVSPKDSRLMLVANVQPIYRSLDGGRKFSKIEKNQMHDDVHHIEFAPDGETVWASHDGGVSVSYDRGISWQPMDVGIGAANVFGLSVAQIEKHQVAFGGYDTGGNFLHDDKWWHVSWGDGFETITSPEDPNVVFTTMQNGMIQASTPDGNFEDARSANSKSEWHTWIRMHPVDHNMIFCGGTRLMRSKDLGMKWEPIFDCKRQDTALYSVYRYFMSPAHPDVMYAYVLDDETKMRPQLWMTKNIRETHADSVKWTRVSHVPIDGWIMNMSIDPMNPEKFWLLYNRFEADGKIWYFDGKKYLDKSQNMGGAKCESMATDHETGRIYVGSNYGIFTRMPDDKKWTLLTGLPGTYIKSLDINYTRKELVVGTFGRGIWVGELVR